MVRLSGPDTTEWSAMHPPELMRRASNAVHVLLGAILTLAAVMAILEGLGVFAGASAAYAWQGPFFLAGALLVALLFFHHGLRRLRLTAKATWFDPQQRQHTMIGILVGAAGFVELLRTAGSLTETIWSAILPIVLLAVGTMFLLHTQHGSRESTRKAVQYHWILGTVLVIAGLLRGAHVGLLGIPGYVWATALFAAAVLLVAYREPEGAYETPPSFHGRDH